jgi:hypothetical protein
MKSNGRLESIRDLIIDIEISNLYTDDELLNIYDLMNIDLITVSIITRKFIQNISDDAIMQIGFSKKSITNAVNKFQRNFNKVLRCYDVAPFIKHPGLTEKELIVE